MPDEYEIGTRVTLSGEAEYRDALREISDAQKLLSSETAKATAAFDKNDKSVEALSVRNEELGKKLELQKQQVATLRGALENAAKEYGAASEKTEEWQKKLNYAERDVIRTETAIKKNTEAINAFAVAADRAAKLDGLNEQLKSADATLEATGTRLDSVREKLEKNWDAKTFDDAQSLAQQAIQKTEEKAELLRQKMQTLDSMGTDKASAEYQELEGELAKAEVAADKARRELEQIGKVRLDQLNKHISEAARNLDAMGNKLTLGLTAPLVAAGAASVSFASDTSESMNKVEVAFGYAAEGVKSWSDTTLTSYGLAKGTALDMAALYGDMATSMGYSQAEAANMSKTLVGLAADLASFKNISVDTANTALKSIFTGETESLKNLGVVMTEVNLKNYALAQGFKTSYAEMDQTEKVAVRLQYVLDATKNSQGDFARTSDGTANQLRIFQESLKEAAAVAGDELLPVITPIISKLSELIQSFGDLDEETRKAVVQTGLFLAALGPMLKVVGGLTAAAKAGATAYVSLTAAKAADTVATGAQATATGAATTAQLALNAAMKANVIGFVITAVGALVAGLLSFAATSALTAEKTESLNQKLRESKAAYESNQAAIETSAADSLKMISTLESLAAVEDKSAAQKAVVLDMVKQLNEAVPELSLAYDEQTDSLNMTTDALRKMAIAMNIYKEQEEDVRRLSELLAEQGDISAKLLAAKETLAQAEEKLADSTDKDARAQERAALAVNSAKANIENLNGIMAANKAEVAGLEVKYGKLTEAINETAEAVVGPLDKLQVFTDVLGDVQGGYELLSKAQKETADSGALSASTITSLLEKYPELGRYLEETQDGYRLADGALQDYIATQRAQYQVAVNEAAQAARNLIAQETGETEAINATTEAIKLKLKALLAEARAKANTISSAAPTGSMYAQAAWAQSQEGFQEASRQVREYGNALNEILNEEAKLGSLDRAFSTLGRDSSSSKKGGKKEKTPAELELEAYREAVKALDHERAMDRISEENYYKQKEALGTLYLQNNLDEARKLEEELYAYHKGAYDRDLAKLDKSLKNKEITYEEHAAQVAALQSQHLTEGSDEWKAADALQAQDRENAYEEKLSALDRALEDEKISYQQHYEGLQALAGEAQAIGEEAERDHRKRLEQNRKSAYADELADQKYFLDMGLITEAQYFRELARLRDQYLTEGSDEWRRANVEIYNYQVKMQNEILAALKEALNERLGTLKDAYDEEVTAIKDVYGAEKDALKDAYDAQKEAAKEAYNAKKDAIKKELELEKERLNGILDGIDKEIQARRELREDEDLDGAIAAAQKRLDAAKAQLEFARTEEDKRQFSDEVIRLEKALQEAVQKKEDTEFYREKELEKEAVRDQLDAAQSEADGKLDAAAKDYEAETKRMEANYKASVALLEADYKAKLAAAEAEYNRAVERLKEDYKRSKSKVESGGGGSDSRYNQKEWSDEVRSIARANNVDLGVAQDMYNKNQWNKDNPDYTPYASDKPAKQVADTAAKMMGAVMAGVAVGVTKNVQNVTRSSAANVTINQASALTSGQITATVKRALELLDK